MNLIKKLLAIALLLLALIALFLSLTFTLGDSFIPGHAPSLMISSFSQYWIMTLVALLIVALVWVIWRRTSMSKVVLVMTLIALATSGVGIYQMMKALNDAGANVDFLAFFSPWDVSDIKMVDTDYTQGLDGPLGLTVYYDETDKQDKPVIFYTHGGGWIYENRHARDFDCKVLARIGYVVVSWDYDLSNSEVHLWDTVERQALEALTWVRDNVAAFGGSTERFYMIGDSAGGQITLDVAAKVSAGLYKASDGGELMGIDAICCDYPVASPTKFWEYDGDLINAKGQKMVEYYIGGTPEEEPLHVAAIEPSLYVTENMPPTFMLVPESDSLVPPQATYDFAELLSSKGVEVSVVSVPHANHAFDYVRATLGNQAYITYIVTWTNAHK